jgi:hypothetical protein
MGLLVEPDCDPTVHPSCTAVHLRYKDNRHKSLRPRLLLGFHARDTRRHGAAQRARRRRHCVARSQPSTRLAAGSVETERSDGSCRFAHQSGADGRGCSNPCPSARARAF